MQCYGVFGDDFEFKGIWETGFSRRVFTFASELDSLQHVVNAEILPTVFNRNCIKFDVDLGKGAVKTAAITFSPARHLIYEFLPDFDAFGIARVLRESL